MNRPKRKVIKPSKYRTVGENATSTEVACGSSMTTTVSGKHDDVYKYKIITLKAEINLLKDECDFLKKEVEKMKSAVPSAMAQRYSVPIVPQPSVHQDQWDSNSSTSESPVEFKKKKSKKRKKKSKRSK